MNNIEEQQVPSERLDEIEALRSEKRRISATIMHNKEARNELYSVNKHGISFSPVTSFITYWIIELLVVLFTVFYVVQSPGGPLIFVLILVSIIIFIAVLNLIFVYPKIRRMRKIDSDNNELYSESRIIDDKIKALEREAN
jgi:hypothetical protein